MAAKTTTSLTTTIRYITGLSSHLSESIGDFLSHASVWDKSKEGPDADRAILSAADVLSSSPLSSWDSVTVGVLIDVACDPRGASFLTAVASKSTPKVNEILHGVLQQSALILDENKSFQDIPSISDFMKKLELPACKIKSLSPSPP